jgi:hypothetical protein
MNFAEIEQRFFDNNVDKEQSHIDREGQDSRDLAEEFETYYDGMYQELCREILKSKNGLVLYCDIAAKLTDSSYQDKMYSIDELLDQYGAILHDMETKK